MPRVVPSDVVHAIDRMFPEMATNPSAFSGLLAEKIPALGVLVELVEVIPLDLLRLEPALYAALIANVAYLRSMAEQYRGRPGTPGLRLTGFNENPIAIVRAALAICPDEAPSPTTTALSVVTDAALRDSIRLDISAANQDLEQGEWKGATVLAG